MKFPDDITKLATGPVRVVIALASATPVPVDISSIVSMVPPYGLTTGWTDLGAIPEGETFDYERDMDNNELRLESRTAAVLKKITEVTRSFAVTLAELTPEITQIVEESPSIDTIAAAANKGAQKKVPLGSISSLTRRRVAFIGERDPGFGATVTLPGTGGTRGALFAGVGYSMALAAEGSSLEVEREELAAREVQFEMYPDPTIADSKVAEGAFLFETPGTISAV